MPFGPFFGVFCMQKWPVGGKDDFVKMSISVTRELHFEGSGGPESIEKGAEKGSQKSVSF